MAVQPSRDALWRKRIGAMQRVWAKARSGDQAAVHQLRVASRRIREALPVISDAQRSPRVKRTRRKVRALTRLLGVIRERDVSLSLLAALEKDHSEDRPAIAAVREATVAERQVLHDDLGKRLDPVKLEKLVEKLTRVAGRAKPANGQRRRGRRRDASEDRKWQLGIAARVVRRAKQLRQAIEHAGALYAPGRLHGVRVSTKKLRYALELGHEARIHGWQSGIRALKEIQDILGQLQDREALVERVRDVDVSHSDNSASAAVDRLTRLLEGNIRRDHAKFVSRRDRLLELCAMVRQQASRAIPIGRPAPTRVTLRPTQRGAPNAAAALGTRRAAKQEAR